MFTPRKTICMVAGILCLLGMAPVASCVAQIEWAVGGEVTAQILRSAAQVWHPIGRVVRLQAKAHDNDKWRYMGTCSEWEDVDYDAWYYFNFSWTGSEYLVPPRNSASVSWKTLEYTPEVHTITLSVNDNTWISQVYPPDTGNRNDTETSAATASVSLGAFDVKASLSISGTSGPIGPPMYIFWSDSDESLHWDDPGWVDAEGLLDGVSMAGGPISLGTHEHGSETITDESLLFPTVTFSATWGLSSEPDGVWRSDRTHWAGCEVDRYVDGTLNSEVWDDDSDTFFLSDYLTFTPPAPDFDAPISWDWNRTIWDLIALAGGDYEAEGATGMGMVFQSDFFGGSSNWEGHAEVRHQSKDYYFAPWNTTPNSKTTPMSYGWTYRWWQFDTSIEGGNSVTLSGDIQGKIEIVECHVPTGDPQPPNYNYFNAYAKAWSTGVAAFYLDNPYYGGTPQLPDEGYIP